MVISDGQYFLWWFCSLNLLSRWTYKVFSDTVWLFTFIISNEVHYVIMNLKYWTITLNLNANSLWRAVFLMPAMFGIRCVVGVQGFYDFCNLWQKIKIVLCVNWLAWRTLFATSTLVAAIVEPVESISSEYPRSGLPVGPLSYGHHCQQKTSPSPSSLWSWSTRSHQGFGWNRWKVYCHSSLVMVFTSLVPPTHSHRRQLCDLFSHAARRRRTYRTQCALEAFLT